MKGKWTGRFAGYNAEFLRRDLLSGLIVGIIAIPLGMAFAIASGVNPQYGIYTTIVAGVLISLFGGSRFQIGGPTGAFVPVLLMIVMQYGYENLLIAGCMAGIILVLMGLFKLGALIQFIPRPVTLGFTAGIAVVIFTGQIAGFLGLRDLSKHEHFLPSMKEIVNKLPTADGYSIVTALVCLSVILAVYRFAPRLPGSLIGLAAATLLASFFFEGHVATIGSAFGAIPNELPGFRLPEFTFERIHQLLYPAFIIAMLGGIESLLSAVVADGMTGSRHSSNRELIGQGIANIVTPMFGGIPATGAIARTATNIKSGAASPFSGVIHSAVVLLVLLLFAPVASRIPLSGMAPVLMVVAWKMSEYKAFIRVLKTKTGDSVVLAITFLLTVMTDLTFAVEVGLVLAVVLFVKRMSEILTVDKVLPDPSAKHEKVVPHMVKEGHDCPQIRIFTVEGALFFGAAAQFERSITNALNEKHRILLLRMGKVPFIDMTGESNLAGVVMDFKRRGGVVLISGIQPQPMEVLERTGLAAAIGQENFYRHTGEAINCALTWLDKQQCLGCQHFAFRECSALSDPDLHKEIVYNV
jgi:SulP family sulfate permease